MAAFSWRAGAAARSPFTQNSRSQGSPFAQAATASPAPPDMSAFRPPEGARQNDLTASNLPYNLWAPAATNAAKQAFGNSNLAQSWTMPGYAQSFNGLTGQPTSAPTQSWAGNDAYKPVGQRAGPVDWTTTGLDGQQYSGSQGWQQAAAQRDAFSGGLIQRLGEYQSGARSGAPSFDFQEILGRANDSLKNNAWQNPFMDPRASNPRPTMDESVYNPTPYATDPQATRSPSMANLTWAPGSGVIEDWRPAATPGSSPPYTAQRPVQPNYGRPSTGFVPPGQGDDFRPFSPGWGSPPVGRQGPTSPSGNTGGGSSPGFVPAGQGEDFRTYAGGPAIPVAGGAPVRAGGQGPISMPSPGWRMPGPDPVGPAYTSKPPSQWTEADWAEYRKPYETGPLRYLVHTPKYYRDNQGRVRYYSGGHTDSPDNPLYMDGDEAWRRSQQRRRDNPGPTFYA